MGEISKDEIRERLGNIDKIRDILLGSKLRDYDSRWEKIESNLSMFQQEIRERVEQTRTALSTDMRAAVDSLEQKIKALSLTSEEERVDLRQQIERTNKKFSNNIQALDEIVYNQTHSLKNELSETRDNLQQDIQTLREQILQELERRFFTLKESKVSRDDVAEVLLELGLRLKGAELVPELNNAAKDGVNDESLLLKQSQTLEENKQLGE